MNLCRIKIFIFQRNEWWRNVKKFGLHFGTAYATAIKVLVYMQVIGEYSLKYFTMHRRETATCCLQMNSVNSTDGLSAIVGIYITHANTTDKYELPLPSHNVPVFFCHDLLIIMSYDYVLKVLLFTSQRSHITWSSFRGTYNCTLYIYILWNWTYRDAKQSYNIWTN
jgi:hypothetical protein